MNRCPHGVYIPDNEKVAYGCSFCRPADSKNTSAAGWFNENKGVLDEFDPSDPFKLPAEEKPQPPAGVSVSREAPLCAYCKRPIFAEFAYATPSEFCKRSDCRRSRREKERGAATPKVSSCFDDDDVEEKEKDDSIRDFTEQDSSEDDDVESTTDSTDDSLRTGSTIDQDEGEFEEENDDNTFEEDDFDDDDPEDDFDDDDPGDDVEPEEDKDPEREIEDCIAHWFRYFSGEHHFPVPGVPASDTLVRSEKVITERGGGDVPVRWDFTDDDTPRLVKIRAGIPVPRFSTDFVQPRADLCAIHGLPNPCPNCLGELNIRPSEPREEEPEVVIEPEPEWCKLRQQQAVEEMNKKLEQQSRWKGGRSDRYYNEPIPEMRKMCEFDRRKVASALDNQAFNEPFMVPDRSLLKDPASIFCDWYQEIKANADERGVPVHEGTRRDRNYKAEYERRKSTEEKTYVEPVVRIIDGVAVTLDEPNQQMVIEILPNGTKKVHVVKDVSCSGRGHAFEQLSPKTYGDLINALPRRLEHMITEEEAGFYKALANGNLNTWLSRRDHHPKSEEDILLLENRIIRHAFITEALRVPWFVTYARLRMKEIMKDNDFDKVLISKTRGESIGGHIEAGKLNRYGQRMALNSFRTAPLRETFSQSFRGRR